MIKGIWFFGLSGSGKSYASRFIKKNFLNGVVLDGDQVRKYVSFDLGYSLVDREMQIKRVFGISKILLKSNLFPIVSTVYFDQNINSLCRKEKILVVKITRTNIKDVMSYHKTYKLKSNVVGVDIKYPKIKCLTISNRGDLDFCKKLNLLIY